MRKEGSLERGLIRKVELDKQLEAVMRVTKLVHERIGVLKHFIAQLAAWENIPDARCAVATMIRKCLHDCDQALISANGAMLWAPRTWWKDRARAMKQVEAPQKRCTAYLDFIVEQVEPYQRNKKDHLYGEVPFPSPEYLEGIGSHNVASTLLHSRSSLSFGGDAGVKEEQFCAVPQEVAFGFYSAAKDYNVASGPAEEPVPLMPPLMEEFRVMKHTSRFKVGAGVFAEVSHAKRFERLRAEHVPVASRKIMELCSSWLVGNADKVDPDNPLSQPDGVSVAKSLLRASRKVGGVLCAPHGFVYGGSTLASVQRISDILLRAPAVRAAYNVDVYVAAKARQHAAVDRVAQMTVDHIEITQLEYSLNPLVRVMERVVRNPLLDAKEELEEARRHCRSQDEQTQIDNALQSCRDDLASQRQHLVLHASLVLASLNSNVTHQTVLETKRKIRSLRQQYRDLYSDVDLCEYVTPCSLVSFGKWGCFQLSGAHWSSCWPRARFQRVMQQIIVRRAKFKLYCLKWLRLHPGKAPSVVKGGLLMVDIQSKQVSEIRSTKQASLLSTLFTGERLDTRAPPKSLFRNLSVDRPWKLRFFEYFFAGQLFRQLLQRDIAASFALAWRSLWERFAFEENIFLESVARHDKRILLRPAAYLYHTDYDDWLNGTVKVNLITRF
jgi:hypothetical protein